MAQCLAAVSRDALASLPSLKSPDGSIIAADAISDELKGKRVALYFAAGWCPMCTSFEPGLLQFREAAAQSGKELEIIYVPSDRSETDAVKRTTAMKMISVPIGEEADAIKLRFKIWSGSESSKLGTGRRSGVPALVVLDSEKGEELKFLAAESEGVKALSSWPLDDMNGIW
jgi:nucleoredoxin